MSEYIIKGPIGSEIIAAAVKDASALKSSGGHSVFIGQVRDDEIDGKHVAAIEYSAYEPVVNQEAEKIRKEIFAEYSDVLTVLIKHSTGVVRAGEISLFVFVSAGHRRQAIEACSEIVEKIKLRLPVWKKEIFEDATHRWTENG